MFTGIIQCQGQFVSRKTQGDEARFVIRPQTPLSSPEVGESIAVNGACLTAESFSQGTFTAYASGETLKRTTLGSLSPGDTVNLEQALTLSSRLGGHMVSGHVDCTATVQAVHPKGSSFLFRLVFPAEFGSLVIPKGSVALDGISLTVNECGDDFLEVNIIPETQKSTTISQWKPGRLVNMETDLIGKYVQRMLGAWQGGASRNTPEQSRLSLDFLREQGF